MKTDESVAPMYDGAGQLVTLQRTADAVKWFPFSSRPLLELLLEVLPTVCIDSFHSQ
jgi:hypothetical protein